MGRVSTVPAAPPCGVGESWRITQPVHPDPLGRWHGCGARFSNCVFVSCTSRLTWFPSPGCTDIIIQLLEFVNTKNTIFSTLADLYKTK